jgi:flagellar motor switch protein FliN
MSPETLPNVSPADQDFARLWAESSSQVLESIHASPFTATPRGPAAVETAPEATADSLWIRFKASGALEGELAFRFARRDGVAMAQLLMSVPIDPAAVFSEENADATSELFRQFAGIAATASKSKYGGEVRFELESTAAPEWKPASSALWIFAAPQLEPIQWTLFLSPELHAAIETPVRAKPESPSSSASSPLSASPSVAGSSRVVPDAARALPSSAQANESSAVSANLDLLLEVELEASLRFGQREMLLREILELRPGSVVELDRRIQEPAELLVAGRVIARGEVVIVDGSYGLRITDIAQPGQRLESLET